MDKVTVSFTREEVNVLVQMLNVAVKQDGLQAARPALHIIDLIDGAVAAMKAPPATEAAETGDGHA